MKRNIRHIARITLLAFLLNAVLPFFAVYDVPTHQAFAKEMSSLFGEKVLICTGEGFKWVKWEDLQSGKEKHNPDSHYKCPLCYLAAHGLKDIITPDTMTLASVENGESGIAGYDYRPAAFYLRSSLHNRAPPSFLL